MRGLGCACVSLLVWLSVLVSVSAQTLTPSYDRLSARSVRLRWFVDLTSLSYTTTVIQYTNDTTFPSSADTFHATYVSSGPRSGFDDHSLLVNASTPILSYILRNLNPSNTYAVRLGYYSSASTTIQGVITNPVTFITPALSSVVSLSSLVASGGCGQLTSSGALYYLNSTTDSSSGTPTIVFTCDVVNEIPNVTIAIVPAFPYAQLNSTQPTPTLTPTALPLSVTSAYVDPLTQYNTSLPLGAPGLITNFTWNVTSESGVIQPYVLSVRRAGAVQTAQIAGPSANLVAMILSPAQATQFSYRGLTWAGTTISKWKAWSDDLVSFPFTALSVQVSGSQATLSVTPAAQSTPGSCSNVYVALFDQNGNSTTSASCISAINDYCSSTPYGAATKWQNPWVYSGGSVGTRTLPASTSLNSLYYPAPPTPTFPVA